MTKLGTCNDVAGAPHCEGCHSSNDLLHYPERLLDIESDYIDVCCETVLALDQETISIDWKALRVLQ